MTQKDYEKKIEEMQLQMQKLQKANFELLNHNLLLSKQINAFYDVKRRIYMLKELVKRHQDLLRNADLRDDDELMALIEIRLQENHAYEDPNFGLKELAEMMGTTQTRLNELFRRSPIHKTVDDYLDYMRLLRSLYYLQTELSWGIAACAQEAGFSVVRTFNRKFQDALGLTPHEFRMLIEEGREQVKEITGKM